MKNIFLFSAVVVLLASCKDKEFSKDEPLIPQLRPALYINGQNNFLYALDPKSGVRHWEIFFGINNITQEPIVVNEFAFVNTDKGIVRIDADKGKIIDTIFQIDASTQLKGMFTAQGDIIYSGTNTGVFLAYNYVKKTIGWTLGLPDVNMQSPGSFYGNLLIVHLGTNIYAIDKNAGAAAAWIYPVPGPITNPVIHAPNLYVLEKSGVLHALNLNTGVEAWTFTTPAPTSTSPIVYGGNIIYGADDNRLYCIDSIAKAPRWVFLTDERVRGSAYADGQVVYFGSYDHYVYAIDIIDATLKWRYRTGALINSAALVSDGIAYFSSYDQHMYAFDTTGSLRWKFKVNSPIDRSPVINKLNNKVVYPAVSGLSAQ